MNACCQPFKIPLPTTKRTTPGKSADKSFFEVVRDFNFFITLCIANLAFIFKNQNYHKNIPISFLNRSLPIFTYSAFNSIPIKSRLSFSFSQLVFHQPVFVFLPCQWVFGLINFCFINYFVCDSDAMFFFDEIDFMRTLTLVIQYPLLLNRNTKFF